ncbi:hypothetical protein, partial [Kingella oralis]|uniref:hypothetical protein n=1 Tax=Kingella oralis TaxID=505 RepID=UPI0028EACBB7
KRRQSGNRHPHRRIPQTRVIPHRHSQRQPENILCRFSSAETRRARFQAAFALAEWAQSPAAHGAD